MVEDNNIGKIFKIVHNDNGYWELGGEIKIGNTFKILEKVDVGWSNETIYKIQVEGHYKTNLLGEYTLGREHIEVKYIDTPLYKKLEGL